MNSIRLLLAASVVVWHSYPLLGVEPRTALPPWLGSSAVNGFFVISGYLICGSRLRLGWAPYLWRRALRIFPAFWTVLLVTAFGFAPLAALIGDTDFRISDGASYVVQNAGLWLGELKVGDTLANVPHPDSWNGSLWTLFFEFGAYLAAMILLGWAAVRRHLAGTLGATLAILTVANLAGAGEGWTPPLDLVGPGTRLGGFFVAGMLVYALRERVTPSWLLVAVSAALVGGASVAGLGILAAVPLALLMLSLGALLPWRWGVENDISYGMYIYAFPVQQLLVLAFGPHLQPWSLTLAALLCTVPLAWASWVWVERPVMGLARRGPRLTSGAAGGRSGQALV